MIEEPLGVPTGTRFVETVGTTVDVVFADRFRMLIRTDSAGVWAEALKALPKETAKAIMTRRRVVIGNSFIRNCLSLNHGRRVRTVTLYHIYRPLFLAGTPVVNQISPIPAE